MAGKPKPRHPVTQPSDPSYKIIALTRGQNALVDAEDFDWLSQWNWMAYWDPTTRGFYARRYINKTKQVVAMHNQILRCDSGERADHKSHDTLDNRKQNLRRADKFQNSYNRRRKTNNTSGFKGVEKQSYGWSASITYNRKRYWLGAYKTPEEAARAYDEAAKRYHGEFAHLNFPME